MTYHEKSRTRGSASRDKHQRGMATVIESHGSDRRGRILGLERTVRGHGKYPEEAQVRGRQRGGLRDRAKR